MTQKWDDARRWREAQRKADKKNAAAYAEAPLFADQLPQVTAEEEYWHHRRIVALARENDGEKLIDLALKILQGKPVPPAVYTDHTFINAKNIDIFYPE